MPTDNVRAVTNVNPRPAPRMLGREPRIDNVGYVTVTTLRTRPVGVAPTTRRSTVLRMGPVVQMRVARAAAYTPEGLL